MFNVFMIKFDDEEHRINKYICAMTKLISYSIYNIHYTFIKKKTKRFLSYIFGLIYLLIHILRKTVIKYATNIISQTVENISIK